MTWHCKSCNRNFITNPRIRETSGEIDREPKILSCPYCNSDKIEVILNLKK